MELTPNLKLPAPGENDTGATALYMERLAREFDAKLSEYQAGFVDFGKSPAIITQTSSTSTSLPFNAGEQFVCNSLWTYTGGDVIYSNVGTPSVSQVGDLPRPGWWFVGVAKASSTLSAAADNSNWPLILEVLSGNVAPGQDVSLGRVSVVYLESNTAGEHWQMSMTVYVPPGVVAEVGLKTVNNTSVTRTFAAGAVGFRVYLGSGDIAERSGY